MDRYVNWYGKGRTQNWRTPPINWHGHRVFCNPPWSNIRPFVEQAPDADIAVLLVPARTNVAWFHRALALGASPRFFAGRPRFELHDGKGMSNSPVDCMLLVFGNTKPRDTAEGEK